MKLPFKFDHAVIAVCHLKDAIESFRQAGFHVCSGGRNGPTENALITFADNSYIELIALRSSLLRNVLRLSGKYHSANLLLSMFPLNVRRYLHWFCLPSGIVDLAFIVDDVQSLAQQDMPGRVIEPKTIKDFQRLGVGGEMAYWRLGSAVDYSPPFFVEDISERKIRVPQAHASTHLNKVCGITGIHLPYRVYQRVSEIIEQVNNLNMNYNNYEQIVSSPNIKRAADGNIHLILNTDGTSEWVFSVSCHADNSISLTPRV